MEATTSTRVAGDTRYDTAAAISAATFPGGSTDVVLATGQKFADALAGNGLAGSADAPILLTPTDSLDPDAQAEIERLGATNVWILGGEAAVSADVEAAVSAIAGVTTVNRIGGADRIDTAAQVAAQIGASDTAIVVDALGFADAVSASPAAYAQDIPVLLTLTDSLPTETETALTDLGVDRVLVVGGTAAVSQAVEDDIAAMGITVDRFEGATRYETAIDFASDYLMAELGWASANGSPYSVATGQTFADALAGGPHAGTVMAPIVLTPTASVNDNVAAFLATNCQVFDQQFVYGGPAAVTDAVADAHAAAAQCTTNQAFTITPGDDLVLAEGDTQTFTVSGIDVANVDIALVDCDNVNRTGDAITFADADDNDVVDPSTTSALITAVNNTAVAVPAATVSDVVPVSGNVTFTITAAQLDCAVAVVFDDADNDNVLDLGVDDVLVDAFAVTGDVSFLPDEAATGTLGADQQIVVVDEDGDFFFSLTDLFEYQSDDLFYIDANGNDTPELGEQVTMAEFEAQLSVGDVLSAGTVYNATDAFQSTFLLDDITPLELVITATDADTTSVEATIQSAQISAGATVTLWAFADGANPATATPVATETATADEDAATAGFQITVAGLQPGTDYDLYATQEVGGEMSTVQAAATDVTTDAVPESIPTITSAALTDDTVILGAVDTNDEITIVFSEAMDAIAEGDQVWATDSDGDLIRIECDNANNGVAAGNTDATCVLSDGADATVANDTLVITLNADPTNIDVAGDGDFTYPLTITAIAGIQDAGDLQNVDLAGSTDLTIS